MQDPEKSSQEMNSPTSGKLSIWHDLYIDVLGGLVPGLLTVVFGGAIVALVLFSIQIALFHSPTTFAEFLTNTKLRVLVETHWEIDVVILVTAYIIGTVYFRQDPKTPDRASALHVWMNASGKERDGLAVQARKNRDAEDYYGANRGKVKRHHRIWSLVRPKKYRDFFDLDTQFPYSHLRCYLQARELSHLLPFVQWCPKHPERERHRTKMFINILKIRLLALFPEVSRDMIRNEAHVRLATSVWYSITSLLVLSFVSLLTIVTIVWLFVTPEERSALFIPSAFTSISFCSCVLLRMHLRKCIHYMRVREVVYVLETANLAKRNFKHDIFDDLPLKSDSQCDQCPALARSEVAETPRRD
jgi:hypothetical protein